MGLIVDGDRGLGTTADFATPSEREISVLVEDFKSRVREGDCLAICGRWTTRQPNDERGTDKAPVLS